MRVRAGDYLLEAVASEVLNDPIREWFDVLTFARDAKNSFRRVCLWEEPGGYAIDVAAWSSQVLQLTFQSDREFVPPMAGRKMKVEHRCLVASAVLCEGLREGLRRWLDAQTDVEDEPTERYRAILEQR